MEARETEAGITQEGCVLKEAHGFSHREYHKEDSVYMRLNEYYNANATNRSRVT